MEKLIQGLAKKIVGYMFEAEVIGISYYMDGREKHIKAPFAKIKLFDGNEVVGRLEIAPHSAVSYDQGIKIELFDPLTGELEHRERIKNLENAIKFLKQIDKLQQKRKLGFYSISGIPKYINTPTGCHRLSKYEWALEKELDSRRKGLKKDLTWSDYSGESYL